jgi:hypothetical protein
MATAKEALTVPTAITLTATSLADMAARESTLVDNTTNLYLDAIISGFIYSGAAVPTGDCYLLLSSSDGTTPSYPATGVDASIIVPRNVWTALNMLSYGDKAPGTELIFLTRLRTRGMPAAAKFGFGNIAISQAFSLGGLGLPPFWGVVLLNAQGQAFDGTAGHTVLNYSGVFQSVS